MTTTQEGRAAGPSEDALQLVERLVELSGQQTALLRAMEERQELEACTLDQIGRIVCMLANEAHHSSHTLLSINATLRSLLDMYRSVHPGDALQLDRLAELKAQVDTCCPPDDEIDLICRYQPCEPRRGGRHSGYSAKSRATVDAVDVSDEHEPWEIIEGPHHQDDDQLPTVPLGDFVGQIVPSTPTPMPMHFRSGGAPPPPGSQAPVGFRTFTETELANTWPPDMSGARGGDVVLMSGNLWLKISLDGGATFKDLKFSDLFASDTTYGGWSGDQVIHYLPAIDTFVLYVQSFTGSGANMNKNVVKVAVASQADLKKFAGGKPAWRRQWHFTPDTFGLGSSWMDFPDITYGQNFLHINTNVFAGKTGKLFFELPLAELQAGTGFSFLHAFIDAGGGSPAQNVHGDDFYWAAHSSNSKMIIYSSRGGDPNYAWRDRDIDNWPRATEPKDEKLPRNVIANAPDSKDWISTDHRVIGATQVRTQLWFAWTAADGDGGYGGFRFPYAHVQIVKFDIAQDFKKIEQMQIWNANHAYTYPSLTTNSEHEVGISLAWGGGDFYGSHAVGILGDFVVWYGAASDTTVLRKKAELDSSGNPVADTTRFGDYLHVRLAHPDTRYFSAFGYAVKADPSRSAPEAGKFVYSYTEFGRPIVPASPLR